MDEERKPLTDEQLELIEILVEQKEREIARSKYHFWGPQGKTSHNYFRPVKRPGDKGKTFRKIWLHRNLKSKSAQHSLCPEAKGWECICLGPGENVCPGCARVAKVNEYADMMEAKGKMARAKDIKKLTQQAKAKETRVWVGITYDSEGNIKGIEPYRLAEFFFRDKLAKLITEKVMSLAKWVKENPEIKTLSEAERGKHYLQNCPAKRSMPDDPKHGYKIFVEKSGTGLETDYDPRFEEEIPLTPDSDEVKVLKQAVKDGTFPDLDALTAQMDYKALDKWLGPVNKLMVLGDEDDDEGPEDELDADADDENDEEPEADADEDEEEKPKTSKKGKKPVEDEEPEEDEEEDEEVEEEDEKPKSKKSKKSSKDEEPEEEDEDEDDEEIEEEDEEEKPKTSKKSKKPSEDEDEEESEDEEDEEDEDEEEEEKPKAKAKTKKPAKDEEEDEEDEEESEDEEEDAPKSKAQKLLEAAKAKAKAAAKKGGKKTDDDVPF